METCANCGKKLDWDEIFEGEDLRIYCEDCLDLEEDTKPRYVSQMKSVRERGLKAYPIDDAGNAFFVQYIAGPSYVHYWTETGLRVESVSKLTINFG
jgi:hypothetical protein